MKNTKFTMSIAVTLAAYVLSGCHTQPPPTVAGASAATVSAGELSGTVTSVNGPEAGVWVIAETKDLPTPYVKIVVTDDRGRYLIPALPKANYSVWVRGYGLIDSPRVSASPGLTVDLKATIAPNAAAAAEYYPAIYWYSMLDIPPENAFAIGSIPNVKSQPEWLNAIKSNGCVGCHQMGNKAIRTIPKDYAHLKSAEAWTRRLTAGQAMAQMVAGISRLDAPRALTLFGDWSDRIARGALPPSQPPRPQGVERNIVITLWDWSHPTVYMHDEVSTDKRNPTVNAYGSIYGATEESTDLVPVLDPMRHVATEMKHPVRDANTPSSKNNPMNPSPYWGDQRIWDSQTSTHNPMFDEKGRVWYTARVRHPDNPAFCRRGSKHPSAQAFPLERSNRHLSMFDPKSGKFTLISTCFGTHHLVFAEDANHTLWTSGGGPAIGWLNRKVFEETGDEQRAQGWTPFIIDTNGNGRRDDYVEPNQPVDPTKDKRFGTGFYGVAVNPADGSVWGSSLGFPGSLLRVNPGPDPSRTALSEVYELPVEANGYGIRGMDIDRNGVVWSSLSSGHLASFDRRKCRGPLNGPKATGNHCPEGWALYALPGPQFTSVKASGSAESSYYTWVDQFDTFGLGKNVPIATGNLNEGLLALVGDTFVTIRVPYPMGFYTKWMDGRIDDPKAGWKGKGLWATTSTRAPFHMETGKGTRPKVAHIQLRPDPLAR